ncbi:MAG TPA: thiamine/thiamine pyrophosphate ABC transporter permease ThiP [Thermohalobaculum sp.]|nr:thiamine/thiamine pyrophosphate ABC transporter permease ThiP [Thermohalobaculum sp.]
MTAARLAPGFAAAILAVGLAGAAIGAVGIWAGGVDLSALMRDPYVRGVTAFTFRQAALSTVLSLVLGLAVARAVHRRAGPRGARALNLLASLALVMPTTVAALGIVAVWGRAGWVAEAAAALGLPGPEGGLYGLPGVLLAHVFFNAPLMARIFHAALAAIPDGRWRLAAQLGFAEREVWRFVEWPAIRRVAPGACGLVFLLCFTSFALVLMLGGGPAASTLEVAIYEAARLEFDLGRAAALSILQLLCCAAVLLVLARFPADWSAGRGTAGLGARIRPDRTARAAQVTDALTGLVAAGVVAAPLAANVLGGLRAELLGLPSDPAFRGALAASVVLGLASSAITCALAWAIAEARRTLVLPTRMGGRPGLVGLVDLASTIYLAVPAIVFGVGLFLMLRGVADTFALAPLLVLAANVLLALPFAVRAIQGRLAEIGARYDRLCASLGVAGWARLRLVEFPAIRRELGFAAALAAALSVGDLGVIALFGSDEFRTLPWLLYLKSGRYQSGEAAAIALVLLALSLAFFVVIERLVGGRHAGR